MNRLQVIFAELPLEAALASTRQRYTYCYDPATINPLPGNIVQVRANDELVNVTVVQLGSDWTGKAKPILRIVAPSAAAPVSAELPPMPLMGDQMQQAQWAAANAPEPVVAAKEPKTLTRVSLAQQMSVIHTLREMWNAGNQYESVDALAATLTDQLGFPCTASNVRHIAEELLELPTEQGGFNVLGELIMQKPVKAKPATKVDMKTRLEVLEDAMHDTMLELAQARAMLEYLEQRVSEMTAR